MKKQMPGKEEEGGLKFMALMLNVEDKHIDMEARKEITPMESLLLRVIRRGTVGALNEQKQILPTAAFDIRDLSDRLGYKKPNHIWGHLKSLHKKNLITREKTRYKNREILGLNHEVFGQILIDKFRLKVVVDNLKTEHQVLVSDTDKTSVPDIQNRATTPQVPVCYESQPVEIINEKTLLDSSRREKTLLDLGIEGKKEINFSETDGEIIDRNIQKFRAQKRLMGLV